MLVLPPDHLWIGRNRGNSRVISAMQILTSAWARTPAGCWHGRPALTVVPYDDYRVPATWEVASFNQGSSEREHCELALCKIVSRLRQRFDVSP